MIIPDEPNILDFPTQKTVEECQADYDQTCKELGHFTYQADYFAQMASMAKAKLGQISKAYDDAVAAKKEADAPKEADEASE